MHRLLLIPSCLCLLLTATAQSSNCSYPCYQSCSYPVYQYPVVQQQVYNVYQPYAIPLYTTAYAPPTAVVSGAVAYQQQITTLAQAGAATSVQGLVGAEVGMAQGQAQTDKFDRLLAAVEKLAGIEKAFGLNSPGLADIQTNCASCHTGNGAKAKFQLFDDSRKFVLRPEDVGKVIFRLTTSNPKMRMPLNGKLSHEQSDRIIEHLTTLPAPNGKQVPPPPQDNF